MINGEEDCSPVLKISMLGGLSAVYENRPINFIYGIMNKSMQLLLLLWEAGEQGILRSSLLNVLYGDEDISNPASSLRATVFRLRKMLIEMGIPEENCINNDKKIYRWNQEAVKLQSDTYEFRTIAMQALNSKNSNSLDCLIRACNLYTGDFLPELAGTEWVEIKVIEYQKIYFECLRRACALLEGQMRYDEIIDLCRPTFLRYGDEEWVILMLDSLIVMNRYEEALTLYHKAINNLFQEYGLPPSEEMMKRYRIINERTRSSLGEVSDVKSHLLEREKKGAYYCTYPGFVDGYRMVGRMAERFGYSAFLMVCTITENKKNLISEKKYLEMVEKVRECIEKSLRKGDIFTRYSRRQFLMLLTGITDQACDIVSARITGNLKEFLPGENIELDFSIISAIEAGIEK